MHGPVDDTLIRRRKHRRGPRAAGADPVLVLANRAPFALQTAADGTPCLTRSASGLVTALEPLVEACSGIWVAHGPKNDDGVCVGGRDVLTVPPANIRYRIRLVALPEHEHRGYYYGFANEGLWPLCHAVGVRPVFRPDDYRMYRRANARFARAAAEEAGDAAPLVFVQDYHLALAPRMLRDLRPSSIVVSFWHIPWPSPRTLAGCAWSAEVLDGLLGSDIAGFQTDEDCSMFLDAVGATLNADVDRRENVVVFRGHVTRVRAYPVGVEWANEHVRAAPPPAACRETVYRELGLTAGMQLGIGVDRLDYTKGIDEKFLAIERLLERCPGFRGRFVFAQIAEPSRGCLPAYRAARERIVATCERINSRFGGAGYRPILLLERHHEKAELYRLYRAADLCYVGSLHDGMNLVAKEFVCARTDESGVLVLSRFAGAARQLDAALQIDPRAIEQCGGTLAAALRMERDEQSLRMRLMRRIVRRFDARWWATAMLRDARSLRHARLESAAPGVESQAQLSA